MPEYYAIVRDLTQRAGMPMPTLYVTPEHAAQRLRHRPQPRPRRGRRHRRASCRSSTGTSSAACSPTSSATSRNRDILIGSVAAAVAMGITFVARMAMWGAMFGGGRRRRRRRQPHRRCSPWRSSPRSPPASCRWRCSRSREFEADRTGAELIGDGEPLARALEKIEASAQQVPMDIDPPLGLEPLHGLVDVSSGFLEDIGDLVGRGLVDHRLLSRIRRGLLPGRALDLAFLLAALRLSLLCLLPGARHLSGGLEHLRSRALSASPCEECGGRTSGSICAARYVPDRSGDFCRSGSSAACTLRKRASPRFELLREPFLFRP